MTLHELRHLIGALLEGLMTFAPTIDVSCARAFRALAHLQFRFMKTPTPRLTGTVINCRV